MPRFDLCVRLGHDFLGDKRPNVFLNKVRQRSDTAPQVIPCVPLSQGHDYIPHLELAFAHTDP